MLRTIVVLDDGDTWAGDGQLWVLTERGSEVLNERGNDLSCLDDAEEAGDEVIASVHYVDDLLEAKETLDRARELCALPITNEKLAALVKILTET